MDRIRQLYINYERSHFEGTDTHVLLTSFVIQNTLTQVILIRG